jgi:hypothetical protein
MKRLVFYLAMLIGMFMFASCATDHVVVYRDYPSSTIIYTHPYYGYYHYNYAYRPAPPRTHHHYAPKPHNHYNPKPNHNTNHGPAVPPKPNPKPTPRPSATVRPNTGHSNGGSMSGRRR